MIGAARSVTRDASPRAEMAALACVVVLAPLAVRAGDLVWLYHAPLLCLATVVVTLAATLTVARAPASAPGEVLFVAVALALFVLTRGCWAVWTPTLPVSDFLLYEQIAAHLAAGEPLPYRWPQMAVLAAWGYGFGLGLVYALFGSSVAVAKGFNVALGALALLGQYLLARRIGGARVARAACVLFLLWPAQLLYSGVLGSEHLAVPLLLLALWCVVRALDEPAEGRAQRMLAVAGVLLAGTFVTRSVLGTGLLATVAVLLLDASRPLPRRLLRCGVVVLAFVATVGLYGTLCDRLLGTAPIAGGWWSLLVGSNAESRGGWNVPDVERFVAHPDAEAANRFARAEAWSRISADPLGYGSLILAKISLVWTDGTYPIYWSTLAMADTPAAARLSALTTWLAPVAQAFHALTLLLALAGALLLASGNPRARAASPALLLLLFATLAHAVVEAQPRYNFPLQPVVFVFAALALVRAAELRRP